MDPKVKARWVKALRSGRYQQGDGYLAYKPKGSRKHSHCCLGVLCEVQRLGRTYRSARSWTDKTDKILSFHANENRSDSYLPKGFGERVGLTYDEQRDLAAMNDGGRSFDEIADWIERYL